MGEPWDDVEEDMPRTVRERMAWALCAHSFGDGFLNDEEFKALAALLDAIDRTYASPKALDDLMARAGKNEHGFLTANNQTLFPLRRLVTTERSLRNAEDQAGMAMAFAHLCRAYWRDFLPNADAALTEAMKIPEIGLQVAAEGRAALTDGGQR